MTESHQVSVQRWQYTTRLMKHMMDEQLLDVPLYLNWLLDLFIRQCRSNDEGPFTLVTPLVLANVPQFLHSSSLSRRLAYYAACKLADMQYLVGAESPCSPSGQQPWFTPYLTCSFHRHVLLSMASIVQSVVIDCPSAAVWNMLDTSGMALSSASSTPPGPSQVLAVEGYGGSPLDSLPCSPSALPLPPTTLETPILDYVKYYEELVKERSVACEHQWSSDKCSQQRGYGTSQNLLIDALQLLDGFMRSPTSGTGSGSGADSKARKDPPLAPDSVDALVDAIFPEIQPPQLEGPAGEPLTPGVQEPLVISDDENLVILMLCRWAVCENRFGCHRALLVATLLDTRQERLKAARVAAARLAAGADGAGAPGQNGDGPSGPGGAPVPPPPSFGTSGCRYPFQAILFEFLDVEMESFMKRLDEKADQFASLICLYAELIRADVFSHDQYMATLISRGLLDTSSGGGLVSSGGAGPGGMSGASSSGVGGSSAGDEEAQRASASKHKTIIAHLPLPQTDDYRHETNQRLVMLYGFGSERSARRNEVKRMGKEMAKILFKRNCVEISEAGAYDVKKKTDGLQLVLTKFDAMNYHDKCCILDTCISAGVKNYVDFGAKKVNHLPLLESVDTLLLLCEKAVFFAGIIDFCQDTLEELECIKHILRTSNPSMAWKFVRSIALCLVGYLRRYSLYLLLCTDELTGIFKALFDLLCKSAPVTEISSSGERCLWAFLADLYGSSKLIRETFPAFADMVTPANQWKLDISRPTTETHNLTPVEGFMADHITNPAKPVEPSVLNFLKQKLEARYSLVLTVFQELMQPSLDNAPEKVRQLANFAADLSCACPSLAADWLGALYTISCSNPVSPSNGGPHGPPGFKELHPEQRSNPLMNPKISHNISNFYALLFAKLAIPFSSFIIENCVKILVSYYGVLLRHTESMVLAPSKVLGMALLLSIVKKTLTFVSVNILDCALLKNVIRSETYLLAAAQDSLDEFKLMQLLKVILMHAELFKKFPTSIRVVNVLGLVTETPFHNYVYETLVDATSQHWVRVKFAGTGIAEFCSKKYLLDQLLVDEPSQPLHLASLLFDVVADGQAVVDSIKSGHYKEQICKLLGLLDLWTLRYALLQVSLLFRQFSTTTEVVGIFAAQCINLFQTHARNNANAGGASGSGGPGDRSGSSGGPGGPGRNKKSRLYDGVWLVAPLVKQLASPVKARVLKECASVLETSGKRDHRQGTSSLHRSTSWLLSEQPFLDLILTCLKDQDEQRDTLLKSLLNQLQDYVTKAKRDVCDLYTTDMQRELRDSLQLRLNLAGGMFETVCQPSHCEAWALLLTQLITTGVVEAAKSEQLYYTCIDMLSTLLHSLLIGQQIGPAGAVGSLGLPGGEQQRAGEADPKRLYTSLVKRLKKEVGERPGGKWKELQQVLFVGPPTMEVVVFEPASGTSGSRSGSSVGGSGSGAGAGLDPQSAGPSTSSGVGTRRGLVPVGRVQVSPWELIDGKPGGPAWAWASAIRRVDSVAAESVDTRLSRLRVHEHWKQFPRNTFPGETEADSTTGVNFGQSPPPPKLMKNVFLEPPNIPCEAPKTEAEEPEMSQSLVDKQASMPPGAGVGGMQPVAVTQQQHAGAASGAGGMQPHQQQSVPQHPLQHPGAAGAGGMQPNMSGAGPGLVPPGHPHAGGPGMHSAGGPGGPGGPPGGMGGPAGPYGAPTGMYAGPGGMGPRLQQVGPAGAMDFPPVVTDGAVVGQAQRPATRGRQRKGQQRAAVPTYGQAAGAGSSLMYNPHMGPAGAFPGGMPTQGPIGGPGQPGGPGWGAAGSEGTGGMSRGNVNTALRERITARSRATAQTPPGGAAGVVAGGPGGMFAGQQAMISQEMEMHRGVLADQFPKGMPHPGGPGGAGGPQGPYMRGGAGGPPPGVGSGGPMSYLQQQKMAQQQQQYGGGPGQPGQQGGIMPPRYGPPSAQPGAPGQQPPGGAGAGPGGFMGPGGGDQQQMQMYSAAQQAQMMQQQQGQRVMPNQSMGMPANYPQQF